MYIFELFALWPIEYRRFWCLRVFSKCWRFFILLPTGTWTLEWERRPSNRRLSITVITIWPISTIIIITITRIITRHWWPITITGRRLIETSPPLRCTIQLRQRNGVSGKPSSSALHRPRLLLRRHCGLATVLGVIRPRSGDDTRNGGVRLASSRRGDAKGFRIFLKKVFFFFHFNFEKYS